MKPDEFDIRILSIEELPKLSAIHRWEIHRHSPDSPVECSVSVAFDENSEDASVALRLTARYTSMRQSLLRPLLTYSIRVRFAVTDLVHRALVTETSVYLASGLLPLMLGISIGALRGMVALRTAGTPLAATPLPVLSIPELLKNFAPA